VRFPADAQCEEEENSKLEVPFRKKDGDQPTSRNKMRELIAADQLEEHLYHVLRKTVEPDNQTWNRRYRIYLGKIASGNCKDISEVLRDLARLKYTKDLSFGERKMYEQARSLVVEEAAYALLIDFQADSDEWKQLLSNIVELDKTHEKERADFNAAVDNLSVQRKSREIKPAEFRLKIQESKEEEVLLGEKQDSEQLAALKARDDFEKSILDGYRESVGAAIQKIFDLEAQNSGSKKKGKENSKSDKAAASKKDAPIEEAPIEEAPKEEAPKEEAPKEEAPKEEAPKEEAPKEEAPKEEAPKEEAPKEEGKT
jgi:RNA polymerase-interacting CarD/CdnL/TRCF family regulator